MKPHRACTDHAGFTMIEVLISLIILMLGLLGLAGLQSRALVAETESYQRVQGLIILRDMADRINANRNAAIAGSYTTGVTSTTAMGKGSTKDCSAPTTLADIDLCQWDLALKGAAEAAGGACNTATGANCLGAMISARGCVTAITTTPASNQYLVQVVWQGLANSSAPPAAVTCASGAYGTESLGLRRALTTVVQIGTISP